GAGGGGGGNPDGQFPLEMPKTRIVGSVVHWDPVPKATRYHILHATEEGRYQTTTSFSLQDFPGVRYVCIKAIQDLDASHSLTSDWTPWIEVMGGIKDDNTDPEIPDGGIDYEISPPRLSLTGNLLVWPDVDNAKNYEMMKNGILSVLDKSVLYTELPYNAGKHTIYVRAVNGNNFSRWASFTRTITDEFGFAEVLDTPELGLNDTPQYGRMKTVKNRRDVSDSNFVVSHNGVISFYNAESLSLADLGLTQADIKSRRHDVRIQAVNGEASSEWSSPVEIPGAAQENGFLGVLAIAIGIAVVLVLASVIIKNKMAKSKY
ncbi:MAG: hypothetical protein FWF56_06900, partial [Firmicutes bacterium]|nr:hypothetical protein [Bacillota bacterium]